VGFGANLSSSVPFKVFLIKKWDRSYPKKGEWVVFRWHGGGLMPKGSEFVKQVHGVTGDTVSEIDRKFYVNGQYQGLAKTVSKTGAKLELGPVGVIPEHRFYAFAPSPDSLDSRYQLTGWIHEGQLVGKAVPLL
jgi:conjugal transfer pilin signal peptidase TrbI